MNLSYIGVTGFMNRNEVITILNCLPADTGRFLMVGVLASQKTLKGEPNKWPNRYPKMADIAGIFLEDNQALNLIHYNTKEPESLTEQLVKITDLAGPALDGFQLNLAWPDYEAILDYHKTCANKYIVLQIGAKALGMIGNSPQALAEEVAQYEYLADHILIDQSGGYGTPLETEKIRAYLKALKNKGYNFGLGVAGGLSSANLGLIQPLVAEFPYLSIDAEGRLRDTDDNLDLVATKAYVESAHKLLVG
ncbi:MAG: hypothetical protein Q7K65_00405 [Candidatus Buchananbacteria bacterium]|nr:hypothetical protein [Candidatus Buchananbacteria bacterium]